MTSSRFFPELPSVLLHSFPQSRQALFLATLFALPQLQRQLGFHRVVLLLSAVSSFRPIAALLRLLPRHHRSTRQSDALPPHSRAPRTDSRGSRADFSGLGGRGVSVADVPIAAESGLGDVHADQRTLGEAARTDNDRDPAAHGREAGEFPREIDAGNVRDERRAERSGVVHEKARIGSKQHVFVHLNGFE